MSASVEVSGLNALVAALQEFPEIAAPELKKAAEAALLAMVDPISLYPAEPPESEYTRTFTLGRAWHAAVPEFDQVAESGFEASLANPTPYGPYVQDSEMQAAVHRGRWQTDAEVMEANLAQTEQYFETALQNVATAIETRVNQAG